jgi:hypothetical protein
VCSTATPTTAVSITGFNERNDQHPFDLISFLYTTTTTSAYHRLLQHQWSINHTSFQFTFVLFQSTHYLIRIQFCPIADKPSVGKLLSLESAFSATNRCSIIEYASNPVE